MATETLVQGGEYQQQNRLGIDDLLKDYKPGSIRQAGLLTFEGVGDNDVYNVTAPFRVGSQRYIAGRVEPRDNEFASKTVFFTEQGGVWQPDHNTPALELQDPFVCFINGELILGGVKAWPTGNGSAAWYTEFWRGPNLRELSPWISGPLGMKGIRLVESGDSVAVFTRPQGEVGGLGTIGFTVIDTLDELNGAVIEKAKLLDGLFAPGEWGGVNQAKQLADGTIGVLGHVARFEPDNSRSYYAMSFRFDPLQFAVSEYRMVAARHDFPPAAPKREDLANVFYPGGWESTDTVDILYGGAGDSCAPFGYCNRLFPAQR